MLPDLFSPNENFIPSDQDEPPTYDRATPKGSKQAMTERELKHRGGLALYTNIGCDLLHYDLDAANGSLAPRGSIELPSIVQYAWPHASGGYLYVACSFHRMDEKAPRHCLVAVKIDPQTGALSQHGATVPLPARPIHLTTDVPSQHVLVAFNSPSGVRIFRISEDFTVGPEIPQPAVTDGGIYAHQIRVTPDNRHAILVTRGISATATKPEQPGALKVFDYNNGVLSNEASIAPEGGFGFGPRHLDFHPTAPWVYVALERQNRMYTFRLENGRVIGDPIYRNETLAEPGNMGKRQLAGTIHVHPNGRFVYVVNRADGTVGTNGDESFAGGENNIAVYEIDQHTGEPRLIQHADTGKIYPRTFQFDPTGQLMFVQHTVPMNLRMNGNVEHVQPGIAVFRIGSNGRLAYERSYDLEGNKETMFWMGVVQLQ